MLVQYLLRRHLQVPVLGYVRTWRVLQALLYNIHSDTSMIKYRRFGFIERGPTAPSDGLGRTLAPTVNRAPAPPAGPSRGGPPPAGPTHFPGSPLHSCALVAERGVRGGGRERGARAKAQLAARGCTGGRRARTV